jgi:hypothetical protein
VSLTAIYSVARPTESVPTGAFNVKPRFRPFASFARHSVTVACRYSTRVLLADGVAGTALVNASLTP